MRTRVRLNCIIYIEYFLDTLQQSWRQDGAGPQSRSIKNKASHDGFEGAKGLAERLSPGGSPSFALNPKVCSTTVENDVSAVSVAVSFAAGEVPQASPRVHSRPTAWAAGEASPWSRRCPGPSDASCRGLKMLQASEGGSRRVSERKTEQSPRRKTAPAASHAAGAVGEGAARATAAATPTAAAGQNEAGSSSGSASSRAVTGAAASRAPKHRRTHAPPARRRGRSLRASRPPAPR